MMTVKYKVQTKKRHFVVIHHQFDTQFGENL